jgi:hypothetical protein
MVQSKQVSGGTLVVGGLLLLAIPELAQRWKLSDATMAAAMLIPMLIGLPMLVVGIFRVVKQRKAD